MRPVPPTLSSRVPPPSLYSRARTWHQRILARGCDCCEYQYPCDDCAREIGLLVELLDAVVHDAIYITTSAITLPRS